MTITAGLRFAVCLFLPLMAAAGALSAEAKPARKIAATYFGEQFPTEVAGFRYVRTTDFETRRPGMGYGIRYQRGPKLWADVFVYDFRRKDIPESYDEKISYAELDLVGKGIAKAVEIGAYRSATANGSFAVPATGTPRLNCDRFQIAPPTGEERDSIACVTNRGSRFVKIRLDGPKGSLGGAPIQAFLKAWVSR